MKARAQVKRLEAKAHIDTEPPCTHEIPIIDADDPVPEETCNCSRSHIIVEVVEPKANDRD